MKSQDNESTWVKCLSQSGSIRAIGIHVSPIVSALARPHKYDGPLMSRFGEAVTSALLLASYCKPGERVNLNIRATGQIRQTLIDATADGRVRGYVQEGVGLEIAAGAKLGPWGEGTMSVLRTIQDQPGKNTYIGTVPLLTGHLAKDLSFYWYQSEQVTSAVGLVSKNGIFGGFLIQTLPGASDADIRKIEKHINGIDEIIEDLQESSDPIGMVTRIMQDIPFSILERRALTTYCTCSKERVRGALALLSVDELTDMINRDKKAQVTCDFCRKDFELSQSDLEEILRQKSGG